MNRYKILAAALLVASIATGVHHSWFACVFCAVLAIACWFGTIDKKEKDK